MRLSMRNLKKKIAIPTLSKKINEFINEYEKDLFNTSNNDYSKYKSELDKLLENLKLDETLLKRLISLEIKPWQLAQMPVEQMKHLKEISTKNGGKEFFKSHV